MVVLGAYWALSGRDQDAGQGGAPQQLQVAPKFELKDASGKPHYLSQFKDRIVLVHFWASWCGPCLTEIPEFTALAEKFKGRPLQLVAVSLDENWEDALEVLPLKEPTENLVSLLDPEGEFPEKFGTYQLPETYLLGPDLKVITKWVGPQEWNSEGMAKVMEAALQKATHAEN